MICSLRSFQTGLILTVLFPPWLAGCTTASHDANLKDGQFRDYRYVQNTSESRAPDLAIGAQLDALNMKYRLRGSDYSIDRPTPGQRKQQVFVATRTEGLDDSRRIREVWSTVYRDTGTNFSALIANRLLEASADYKLGGFAKEKQTAVFTLKLRADADNDELKEAIDAVAYTADALERELAEGADRY